MSDGVTTGAGADDGGGDVDCAPYDALLLLSFGGPEKPDDVMPFLRLVTGGRGIPDERLAEVAEHYHHFGGRSPINEQNRRLLGAIRDDLAGAGIDIPVYWGNRNWHPFLTDTVRQMSDDGIRRVAVFATSAYSSYSGCRQYREDLAAAAATVAAEVSTPAQASPGTAVTKSGSVPRFDKLRHYFNHPGFVEPVLDAVRDGFAALPSESRADAAIVFVTHSIPTAMNAGAGPAGRAYAEQHRALADEVVSRFAAELGRTPNNLLTFCSRSGPPSQPWLEPDVNDHLRDLAREGISAVVAVPFGFVSDHMEVIYDLDVEAAATAAELGLTFVRAGTVGLDPRFVAVPRELLLERAATERALVELAAGGAPGAAGWAGPTLSRRPAVAGWPAMHDVCPAGCCPNLRGAKPALCGLG